MSSEGQPTIRLTADHDRWEYRVMLMGVEGFFGPNVNVDQLGEFLNSAGESGWELVSVLAINGSGGRTAELMGTFKRRRA